tara:strand:- start:1907 stop:2236 length:330 start_codon:yes stop_codon:yes gene_type:complete
MVQLSGQDWETVRFTKKQSNLSVDKNKQNNQKYVEDEIEKKPTISLSNSKLIQGARTAKKMTQQQLAQKINKDQKTIQLYESGKTAPDYAVMCKIEKALGIKLNKKKNQ